jgi:hypothetical protein
LVRPLKHKKARKPRIGSFLLSSVPSVTVIINKFFLLVHVRESNSQHGIIQLKCPASWRSIGCQPLQTDNHSVPPGNGYKNSQQPMDKPSISEKGEGIKEKMGRIEAFPRQSEETGEKY